MRILSEKKLYNEIVKLKLTEAYKEMKQKKLSLLKSIDLKSPFLSGYFLEAFRDYWFDFRYPYKYIEYDLPFGFRQTRLSDFY